MNTDEHGWFGSGIQVHPWVRPNAFLKLIRVHLCSSVVPMLFGLLTATQVALAHGPDIAKDVGFEQHPGAQLPRDDAFVDDRGRRVTFGEALRAKPAVLVLGYLACKDLCPMTLSGVAHALDASGLAAGRDYRALFVSIDPRETVSMLSREKAERIGAKDRAAWTFLRGDSGAVAKLARAVGFRYRYEAGRDAFAHAAGFAVLTPEGAVSRYFLGVRFDPASLAAALREARGETIAPPASPLLLLCYHFDPATGRYTLAILGILRAVIAAMFLLAGAYWLWRRRRP
jgi:protein SCO1/2